MTSLIPFRLQAVILSNLFIYEMLEELPEQTLVVNNIKGKNATAFVFHNFCINDSVFLRSCVGSNVSDTFSNFHL